MDNPSALSNAKAKFNQHRNLILVIIVLILITFGFITYYWAAVKSRNVKEKSASSETIKVSGLSNEINDSSIALQRLERKLEEYEQKLAQDLDNEDGLVESNDDEIFRLQEKMSELESKIQMMGSTSGGMHSGSDGYNEPQKTLPSTSFPRNVPTMEFQDGGYPLPGENSQSRAIPVGISIDSFKQDPSKTKKSTNYIPAGTYVKALLIQGIDASASISSQSDPRPVLMRIISNGSLPNEVSAHIEDCRLIGAAYGDVSSERAYIRLETMSCTLKSKEVLENVVDGYVVGEDGKAGIRGVVVRREKALLSNSFMSGLASGFGSGLSESFQSDLVSPLGVVTEVRSSDVFKNGAAEGAANSFDRLSKYYIDRAEQFQPVIQIGAGREIDVVFKKGFRLYEGSKPIILAQDE